MPWHHFLLEKDVASNHGARNRPLYAPFLTNERIVHAQQSYSSVISSASATANQGFIPVLPKRGMPPTQSPVSMSLLAPPKTNADQQQNPVVSTPQPLNQVSGLLQIWASPNNKTLTTFTPGNNTNIAASKTTGSGTSGGGKDTQDSKKSRGSLASTADLSSSTDPISQVTNITPNHSPPSDALMDSDFRLSPKRKNPESDDGDDDSI